MTYPKKTGFNLYQSRHCAYITYSVKPGFEKLSLYIWKSMNIVKISPFFDLHIFLDNFKSEESEYRKHPTEPQDTRRSTDFMIFQRAKKKNLIWSFIIC